MMVRQIDHVFCALSSPAEVDDLMTLFCRRWQLPAAWQARHFSGFWRFYSGGIYLGNVIFEPVCFESATRVKPHGISFQPGELTQTLALLEERAIPYFGPMPYLVQDEDDRIHHYWTNIVLDGFTGSNLSVFLCEFKSNPVFPRRGMAQARAALNRTLRQRKGGPLGIVSVNEISVGAAELHESRSRWQRILDPAPVVSDTWRLDPGPALHLIPAADPGLKSLQILVRSLPAARRALAEGGAGDRVAVAGVKIRIKAIAGLDLCLV